MITHLFACIISCCQHCPLFWVAFLLWKFFSQWIHETVLTAAKDFFCWNDGCQHLNSHFEWTGGTPCLAGEGSTVTLQTFEATSPPLARKTSHFLSYENLFDGGWRVFFLVLGSSIYSIGKWISRIAASCLGQGSGIFLCEWHAQNQTWHHSCWCASDWANAIIMISILSSIPFLMLPNSLFAFYSLITAVHCLHSFSSVLFQISAGLAVWGCVSS